MARCLGCLTVIWAAVYIARCNQQDQEHLRGLENRSDDSSELLPAGNRTDTRRHVRSTPEMSKSKPEVSITDTSYVRDEEAPLPKASVHTLTPENFPHSQNLYFDNLVSGSFLVSEPDLQVEALNQSEDTMADRPTTQSHPNTSSGESNRETQFKPVVDPPKIALAVSRMNRIICLFNASASKRTGAAKFLVENINISFCSDLYYYQAKIHPATYQLREVSNLDVFPVDENVYLPRFTAVNDFKLKNAHLRTFLTVTDSKAVTFTDLLLESDKTNAFVKSCSRNLRLWGFDGLNLHWLYPSHPSYLTTLLRLLRVEFTASDKRTDTRLYLAVSLDGSLENMADFYQVDAISELVDYINLLAYLETQDISNGTARLRSPLYSTHTSDPVLVHQGNLTHSKEAIITPTVSPTPAVNTTDTSNDVDDVEKDSENKDDLPSEDKSKNDEDINVASLIQSLSARKDGGAQPVHAISDRSVSLPSETFSLEQTLRNVLTLGADLSKINVAISLVGQAYILSDVSSVGRTAQVSGPSDAGIGGVKGQFYFYEMCRLAGHGQIMRASLEDRSPFWYNSTLWVTYEDLESIAQKVDYLKEQKVMGIMLISQSEDDFSASYCNSGPFPVSNLILKRSSFHASFHPLQTELWQQLCSGARSLVPSCQTALLFSAMYMYACYSGATD